MNLALSKKHWFIFVFMTIIINFGFTRFITTGEVPLLPPTTGAPVQNIPPKTSTPDQTTAQALTQPAVEETPIETPAPEAPSVKTEASTPQTEAPEESPAPDATKAPIQTPPPTGEENPVETSVPTAEPTSTPEPTPEAAPPAEEPITPVPEDQVSTPTLPTEEVSTPTIPVTEPIEPVLPKPAEASEKEKMKPLPPKTGIDTINIEEGGNWLLKRKALEDTADIIEKIINNFSKILEASTSYKIKRNKLDNDYDLYITTVGFNLGDLDQVLSNLVDELESDRKEDGDLTADEREAMATLNEKKNEIKQLQKDLNALTTLDQEIDKVVDTVDSQIKTANNYQNQAWKNFQEIKKVLSDEKAEDLYYRTVSLQKNMQDIYTYLTGTLSTYFSNQIDSMRNQMDTIKSKISSLQSKGVDLQKRIEEFEKQDEQRDEEQRKQEQEEAVEQAIQQEKKKLEKATWWQSFKNVISWPFVQIKNLWNATTNFIMSFFKPKEPKKAPSPEPVAETPVAPKEAAAVKEKEETANAAQKDKTQE